MLLFEAILHEETGNLPKISTGWGILAAYGHFTKTLNRDKSWPKSQNYLLTAQRQIYYVLFRISHEEINKRILKY